MEHHEQIEQAITDFLNRFKPKSKQDFDVLRAIQRDLTAGQSLMTQIERFSQIADSKLLEEFYHHAPAHRHLVTQNDRCPAELLSQNDSTHQQEAEVAIPPSLSDLPSSTSERHDPVRVPSKDHPLLNLDRDISLDLKGLSDYAASLPAGEVSGKDKAGCTKRIENLQRQFDLVPAVLQETDLTDNDSPIFYDLLTAKQNIYKNQRLFSRLRIGLMNRFSKDSQDIEEDEGRSLIDQESEKSEATESEGEEPSKEDLLEEDLEAEEDALRAEEEARTEAEAKAAKKAANEKRQKRLQREGKEQEDRAQQELRTKEEQLRQEALLLQVNRTDKQSSEMEQPTTYATEPCSDAAVSVQSYSEQSYRTEDNKPFDAPYNPANRTNGEAISSPEYEEEVNRSRNAHSQEVFEQEKRAHQEHVSAEKQAAWEEYLKRQEQSLQYESFGKGHIDFSGKEQHGNVEPYPAVPEEQSFKPIPNYNSQDHRPTERINTSESGTDIPSPQKTLNDQNKPVSEDQADWQRKRDRYEEAEQLAAIQREDAERQLRREAYAREYDTQANQPQSYESIGKGHVDFSGKGQHGNVDSHVTDSKEYKAGPIPVFESQDSPAPRPNSSLEGYAPQTEKKPTFVPESEQGSHGWSPVFTEPINSKPFYEVPTDFHKRHDHDEEPNRIFITQQDRLDHQQKQNTLVQNSGASFVSSQRFEPVNKELDDKLSCVHPSDYQPTWPPPISGKKSFQPFIYTAHGVAPITGDPVYKASLSNQEIYQEALSTGKITHEMTRAMRSNLETVHREYKEAANSPSMAEAAKRYKAEREAVMLVNTALKNHTITFAKDDIKPDSIANINPVYKKVSDSGFTAYMATPKGFAGTSFNQEGPTGKVFIHNAPGQTGKEVWTKDKPMLVTKEYEARLAGNAQRAKDYMKQRMSGEDASSITGKLSAIETVGYHLCIDAYEGFRRAKSEGLVKVTTGNGALDTPNPVAWASREQTYRRTMEARSAKSDRYHGDTPRQKPNQIHSGKVDTTNVGTKPKEKIPTNLGTPFHPHPNENGTKCNDKKTSGNQNVPTNLQSLINGQPRFWDTLKQRSPQYERSITDMAKLAPFGSVFSVRFNRGRYTTGEMQTSAHILGQRSKLRRATVLQSVGSSMYGQFTMYAPQAGHNLLRKVYSMAQSGGEAASQSIRTFEQGRYYSGAAIGVASAYLHRNVGNVHQFQKTALRTERHVFGFTRELSSRQIGANAHTKMNEARALKKELRAMYEHEAGLSVEERKILAEKIKEHQALGRETTKWTSLQKARKREKIQTEILQQLHRNPSAHGMLTKNALDQLDAERMSIHAQRRAILKSQPDRSALTKRIAQLQAKDRSKLTPAELQELQSNRKKLSALDSNPQLKALNRREQAILKARKTMPDETAVSLKQIRLKDANKLRSDILKQHGELEAKQFKEFLGVKNKAIKANKVQLEKQSEFAKRRLKVLLKKGKRTAAEEAEVNVLLKKLQLNQKQLKLHADILKLREIRDMKLEVIDKVRKRLMQNKQQKRLGRMALVSFMMKPLQEGDSIGAQGLAKGISYGTNPYIQRLVRSSLRTTFRFNAFAIKKIGKWTGLDVVAEPAIAKVKHTAAQARRIANTPREFKKRTIKTVSKAARQLRDRMTPQFIKTGVETVKTGWVAATNYLKKTKLGKAYEATAQFLSKVKHILGTVGKVIGGIAAKAVAIFLVIFLLVGILTVIGGAAGGSVSTFTIMSPDVDEEEGKLDLSAYVDVYKDKMIQFSQELSDIRTAKEYENITEIRVGPHDGNNMKEILSMMAVRMHQDLDMDENPLVEKYIKSLFDDSHTISAKESDPYSCSGCKTRMVPVDHNEDCPEGCTEEHEEEEEYCPGTHVDLNVTITTLKFDEIFYADTMGNAEATYVPGELIGTFVITHYCDCTICCGPNAAGITATGTTPKANHTIAVDPDVIPLGSTVIINGQKYVAEDTGGAINGNRIDIYMDSHSAALAAGRKSARVYWPSIEGDSYQETGEWDGWTDPNIDWAKVIFNADWDELYTGISGVSISLGNTTDLSGVDFVDGNRNGNQNIVDIALSQLGQSGGEPYWSWYGFESRVEWCACFVSWCANQAGTSAVPSFAHCAGQGVPWFQTNGQWASRSDTTPVAGDIIFFDWGGDGVPDHVGIVAGSDGSTVYTVEGNSGDQVKVKNYPLTSSVIFGYGLPNY